MPDREQVAGVPKSWPAVMHRLGVATVVLLWLPCAMGALACSSEKPRTDSVTLAQSAPSVDQTRRLQPNAFANLPSTIVSELQRVGCTIPQTDGDLTPHNVIEGRFLSATNRDWAVLCSRDRVSSILVFPNGGVDDVREVESSPDADWLQGTGGSRIGFSRAIAVADARYIVSQNQEFGGPKPPLLDHDGINNIFVGKGSTVLYWRQGKWLRLQGAD